MPANPDTRAPSQRIDKWLWYARMTRTRSLAGQLVGAGRVRVNGTRVRKPSHLVRPGDMLTFVLHDRLMTLEVAGTGTRRGPFREARMLYRDHSASLEPLSARRRDKPGAHGAREPGSGRPTKKQRRALDLWMQHNS